MKRKEYKKQKKVSLVIEPKTEFVNINAIIHEFILWIIKKFKSIRFLDFLNIYELSSLLIFSVSELEKQEIKWNNEKTVKQMKNKIKD